jgi:peptidoglycan hydrolase CwlO-like protein
MKPIKSFRNLTTIIMSIFILSLFSGVVAAQATAGDQYEKAKDELKQTAKDYLLKAIYFAQSQLQVMKSRVEDSENEGSITFDAVKIIDGHTAQLEQLKAKVEKANSTQEFRDAHKELKKIAVDINLETRYYMGIVLNHRIDNFIIKADNVSVRIDSAIQKLKAQGNDTTNLEKEVADFKDAIKKAKESRTKTKELYENHNGFSPEGTITNEKNANKFLEQGNKLQKETIKDLRHAGNQVIKFVKDIRKLVVGAGVTTTLTTGGFTTTLSATR